MSRYPARRADRRVGRLATRRQILADALGRRGLDPEDRAVAVEIRKGRNVFRAVVAVSRVGARVSARIVPAEAAALAGLRAAWKPEQGAGPPAVEKLVAVSGRGRGNGVLTIYLDEAVHWQDALDPSHYRISHDRRGSVAIDPKSIEYDPGARKVRLRRLDLESGETYRVSIESFRDCRGRPLGTGPSEWEIHAR